MIVIKVFYIRNIKHIETAYRQIFDLLINKKIKKSSTDISFNQMNNFEKLIRKNRFINVTLEHCFEVTVANFEQIINNDFIQFEAE